MLSPWHEKFTNTHPSRSGDIGVGVGGDDVGAPSVDVGIGVGIGVGVESGASVEGLDAVVVAVFCAKT